MKNIYKLNLNLIKALDALLEYQNVSKAAGALCITQPAMSNLLNQLRQLLNDDILIRRGKSMIPTKKALILQKQLQNTLPQLENLLLGNSLFDPKTSQRHFIIAANDYVEYLLLPSIYHHIEKAAPNIQLTVIPIDNIDDRSIYENQNIDLGIGWSQNSNEPLEQEKLWTDHSVCMARKAHPIFSTQKPITLQDYLSNQHILMRPSHLTPFSLTDEALKLKDKKRRIALHVMNILPGLSILKESNLIGTIPALIAKKAETDFRLKAFKPPFNIPSVDISMNWHSSQTRDLGHQWLRKLVKQVSNNLLKNS